ncbi:hypothetical protein BSR28_07725 [Boudabousia liubingyangii]|uniref:AAA family ATPase n=1 Tax=Boudabousia liubingyangii TaxID=1921764 RepID=UPI00093EBBBF|nr:hypothetical protein [Boudabousia liubingyangii]OKL46404.1 hypothetical protein BSR28_07725 [Boudabousia liubingyangii]
MDARKLVLCLSGSLEIDFLKAVAAEPTISVQVRCADLNEALAASSAGIGNLVLIQDDPELGREHVEIFHQLNSTVFVIGTEERIADLYHFGVDLVITQPQAAAIVTALKSFQAVSAGEALIGEMIDSDPLPESESAKLATAPQEPTLPPPPPPKPIQNTNHSTNGEIWPAAEANEPEPKNVHKCILIRGTGGAPGRSTIAIELLSSLCRSGQSAVLIDADLSAPSLHIISGVITQWSGIAVACTLANRNDLDKRALEDLLHTLQPEGYLLSGLNAADRWQEIVPSDFKTLIEVCKQHFDWVLIDTAAWEYAEDSEYFSTDPRLEILKTAADLADQCITVGKANPVGIARLVRVLKNYPVKDEYVALNQVSPASAGKDPAGEIYKILAPLAAKENIFILPFSRQVEESLLRGISIFDHNPKDPFAGALNLLASVVQNLGTGKEAVTGIEKARQRRKQRMPKRGYRNKLFTRKSS